MRFARTEGEKMLMHNNMTKQFMCPFSMGRVIENGKGIPCMGAKCPMFTAKDPLVSRKLLNGDLIREEECFTGYCGLNMSHLLDEVLEGMKIHSDSSKASI